MSERALNITIKKNLEIYGKVRRVENRVDKGYPDWSYTLRSRGVTVSGHIEAKFIASWPKRSVTPVMIKSLRLGQVVWLKEEHEIGGRAWLILKVGRMIYLLLTAPVVEAVFERKLTAIELIAQSCVYSTNGFPTKEILETLTMCPVSLKEAA